MTAMAAVRLLMLVGACFTAVLGQYDIVPPIPVPTPEHGMRYNPHSTIPAVRLEIFLEVHCSDSTYAWPIMKDLQTNYGNDQLDIIIQHMALPYHRNGFLGTQGVFVIEDYDPARVVDYIEANLANTANFSTSNTQDMTEFEVIDMLANLAASSTGIDANQFRNELSSKISHTIAVWKYGVKRGVSGTPIFFLNGVDLGIGVNVPTYDDWVRYLDPIISG